MKLNIEKKLKPIAIEAVVTAKDSKLIAKNNPKDKFALHFASIAEGAVIGFVSDIILGKNCKKKDLFSLWLDEAITTQVTQNKNLLEAISFRFAGDAYDEILKNKN